MLFLCTNFCFLQVTSVRSRLFGLCVDLTFCFTCMVRLILIVSLVTEYVTCRTTATLHKQTWQNMSYYDMHREYVLTQLMPSVSMIVRSSMVTPVNRNTSIHQIGYLRNDLELLLRTIGRLIRVDDTAHSISQQVCSRWVFFGGEGDIFLMKAASEWGARARISTPPPPPDRV